VAANINSEPDIAQQVALLDRGDSSVRFGNLQLVPIEESLLYIQPLYVEASAQTAVPELKRVIVVHGDDVVMEPTLREALESLFGAAPETQEETPDGSDSGDGEGDGDGGEPSEEGTEEEQLAALFEDLETAQRERDAALESGDLGAYQEAVGDIDQLLDRLEELLAPDTTTTTTAPAAEA
jgi:uncharacterized membrane protein (UPF0182 family)